MTDLEIQRAAEAFDRENARKAEVDRQTHRAELAAYLAADRAKWEDYEARGLIPVEPYDDRPPEAVHAAARLEMLVHAIAANGQDWIAYVKRINAAINDRKPLPGKERAFQIFQDKARDLLQRALEVEAAA